MVSLLSVERQVEIFQQFKHIRLGGWTRQDATALAGSLGWTFTPSESTTGTARFRTHLGTGDALLLPVEDVRLATEYVELRVPVGAAADWRALYRAAVKVMGYEAPLLGGSPQVWARWRNPVGNSVGLLLAEDTVWVTVTDTDTWEDEAYRVWKWGEGTEFVPYQWLAFQRHATLGGMPTNGRRCDDWADIGGGAARTFDSLLAAVDAFAAPGSDSVGASFRITKQAITTGIFFDVTVRPGRVLEFARASAGAAGLDQHGWHSLDKRTWRCRWAAATSADCAAAADVVVRTMRDQWQMPLKDREARNYPGYSRARVLGRSIVDLPGLGFDRSRDNR